MKVQELFRRLSYGELSNLSLGSEGIGTIADDRRDGLIHHTNEALLRLYSRFVLRESDVILMLQDFITNYYFLPCFSLSFPEPEPGTTPYILDTLAAPFEDDLIKVLTVSDQYGQTLPLNDTENVLSVFTPQPNMLQVPMPVAGQHLVVGYQARHPKLDYGDLTACIEIPAVLEGALTAYIAHLVYSNMNGQENAAKAAEHLGRYDSICQEVVDRDLVNSSSSTSFSKLHSRGFV